LLETGSRSRIVPSAIRATKPYIKTSGGPPRVFGLGITGSRTLQGLGLGMRSILSPGLRVYGRSLLIVISNSQIFL
jgi:hypothetical protein